MKKHTTTIKKLFALAALAVAGMSTGFAQANLGADCGCPTPVSSRPTVLLSTLAVASGANEGDLNAAVTILDCAHTWILDKKIFVPSGKTLQITPGTVIKGRIRSTPDSATCLIVERGGKILANGTATCQIVFTAEADNLDGTYPIANFGKWGGVVIAGRATNNLNLAINGPYAAGAANGKIAIADGLGTFEGFAVVDPRLYFGANLTAAESFDDNDDSGILRYASIRHAGAILNVGGEINALSLGSVGRGTTIDHLDVVSSADDGIEFWGGTVNIKYYASLFGNDDNFDWDDGYSGKVQFVFALKTSDTLTAHASDNGFECDADDQKSNLGPRSHPVIYNVTMLANVKNHSNYNSDETGPAAIMGKELTEGEIYNSVFAGFEYGCEIKKAIAAPRTIQVYDNWLAGSFKVICNTFVGSTLPLSIDKAAPSTSDTAKFYTTDMNQAVASLPGFTYVWNMNSATNAVTTKYDAIPNPALSTTGCPSAPSDGFFVPVNYRGAFASSGKNWMSDWAYAQVLNTTTGLQPCPTDINQDGVTNNVDFLQLLGNFNNTCN